MEYMETATTGKVKLKDIAMASGVTVATVSAALNGTGRMSDMVRSKIIEMSRKMNYQPNPAAQLLKNKKQTDVGLVINDRTDLIGGSGLYLPMITEFIQLCDKDELRNQIEFVDTVDNPNRIPWFMSSGFASGILHVGYINEGIKKWLGNNPEYPFVAFCEPWKYCIRSKFDSATFNAVQYLAAMGHRRIGIITGPVKYDFHQWALSGYHEAVKVFQIDNANGEWVTELALKDDRSTMEESIAYFRNMLRQASRPSALLCVDMRVARAAIYAVMEMGLRVPDDLSIIGYGGNLESDQTYPAITTVMHDMEKIVVEGVRMLQRLIAGREPLVPELWIEPQLLIKGSVITNSNR